MSENDLEQKAKTISDLAMSGQGCALAAQVKSMEAARHQNRVSTCSERS